MNIVCKNRFIRNKLWRKRKCVCSFCKRKKRLLRSWVFFTRDNKTHLSQLSRRWIIDWENYRWICKDCIRKIFEEWKVEEKSRMVIEECLIIGHSLYGRGG